MFHSFERDGDPRALHRLSLSATAAIAITAALLLGARAMSAHGMLEPKKKSVDVSFRPPPPPPPPAKIDNPPPPPKKVPPKPTVVESAPAPMVAPEKMPEKPAPEAPKPQVAAIKVAVGGTGDGVVPATGGPPGPPEEEESPAPQVAVGGPVNLPEDAEPPEADESNAMPEYPEVARTAGQESVVILKVVIEKDGAVGRVQVMKGEEPFVSAALDAVKGWRYAPATLEGQPIAVYRIVKIPFRLRS